MRKDIVIIAQYLNFYKENGNSRFTYLARLLHEHDIEIITSKFVHWKKKHRAEDYVSEHNYHSILIDEPGYTKNVTIKRFYSHFILARNLKKYLYSRKKPDVIYCSIPSISVGVVVAKYCMKNNIKFIIDVQDLWPEAFKLVFKIPILNNLVLYPIKFRANFIYKSADEVIAVSQTYVNRVMKVNEKSKNPLSIYLGTDLNEFDSYKNTDIFIKKPSNEIWLAYVGTLGHSYNLKYVIDALSFLIKKNVYNLKFIIMGDGPLRKEFEDYSTLKGVNANFLGKLPYGEMVKILSCCDIAVNPIVKGSASSIINKHGDYAAAALPVLNTQESQEYRELLEKFNCGFNSSNDDLDDFVEKLFVLYNDSELRKQMGINSRMMFEKLFDRNKTYKLICKKITE